MHKNALVLQNIFEHFNYYNLRYEDKSSDREFNLVGLVKNMLKRKDVAMLGVSVSSSG